MWVSGLQQFRPRRIRIICSENRAYTLAKGLNSVLFLSVLFCSLGMLEHKDKWERECRRCDVICLEGVDGQANQSCKTSALLKKYQQ